MARIADITTQLQAACGRAFGPGSIGNLRHLTDGWESEVWSFHYIPAGTPRRLPLILRLYVDDAAARKVETEAAAMPLAEALGYPVPRVLYSSVEAEPFGRPFMVMQRVAGEVLGNLIRRRPAEPRQLIASFTQW